MEEFRFTVKYRVDGVLYQTHKERCVHYTIDKIISEDNIKLVIHPRADMQMLAISLDCPRVSDDSEVFFANGFQAWTTTREYRKTDVSQVYCTPMRHIAKVAEDSATCSGDYRIYPPEKGAGHFHSWTYTYYKKDGKLEFYGSTGERNGYTIFAADMAAGTFSILKDIEGKTLTAGEDYEAINVLRFEGAYDEVFDKYFAALGVEKPRIQHMSGYTSWYNYFRNITEDIIVRDIEGLSRAGDSANIFQIDDGFMTKVGDWTTLKESFPHGMKYLTDKIHAKGYNAGLWLAPFNCTIGSQVYKEHKDWLILQDGKPVRGLFARFNALAFDLYNEEFRAHIKEVFRVVFEDWGFDMVKLDFLYSQAMYPRNGKTRGEIMCDAVDFLRECCGDKLFLGCGVPLGTGFGVFDACRIGCDVAKEYGGTMVNRLKLAAEVPSAQNSIVNAIFRRHLNGRAFVNDPDVFFLRDFNIKFTMDQKLLLGFVNHLCGGVLFVSDDVGQYDDETLKYVKYFFGESDAKIVDANYVGTDDIELKFERNGVMETLKFNLKTGDSNVRDLIKL